LLTIGELSSFPGNWGSVRVSIHVHPNPKWVVLCDWSYPAPSEMRLDAMAGLFRPCVDLAGSMADACRNRSDEASGCEACRFRPFPCASRQGNGAKDGFAALYPAPTPPHAMGSRPCRANGRSGVPCRRLGLGGVVGSTFAIPPPELEAAPASFRSPREIGKMPKPHCTLWVCPLRGEN
jgi:hypothetical protein